MNNFFRNAIRLAGILVLICSGLVGQENAGKGLPALVQGNERFGRRLLEHVHSQAPQSNVVLSPFSLTMIFATFRTHSFSRDMQKEINDVFGWPSQLQLSLPARQLLAVFDQPGKPVPCKPDPERRRPCSMYVPEAAWITNTFLYRSPPGAQQPINEYFLRGAQRNFGFKIVSTGPHAPQTPDWVKAQKPVAKRQESASLSPVSSPEDVWITSRTHLQTAWRGNTFSMSQPREGEFHTNSGAIKRVQMLDSELGQYFYTKTDAFEAAALPGVSAYMLVVLPAPGADIHQLEHELTTQPELLDSALQPKLGVVTMPVFQVNFQVELSAAVQGLGITKPFRDLDGIINIPKSHLTRIEQRIDIEVDRDGIRANAETVAGVVYGGILAGRDPFRLILNRPFIFLIRDQTSNALLFIGAVMDPAAYKQKTPDGQ